MTNEPAHSSYHCLIPSNQIEDLVIHTQESIRKIALRIERSYCRRYPHWVAAEMTPGVWTAAATCLVEATSGTTDFPVDPELYVALQPLNRANPDPWAELAQKNSVIRYRRGLKRIVRQLRRELNVEITRGECRVLRGLDLERVLETEGTRISPLSRYILCLRAGRVGTSLLHHEAALKQIRSCPLYRLAGLSFLTNQFSRALDPMADSVDVDREIIAFSRN